MSEQIEKLILEIECEGFEWLDLDHNLREQIRLDLAEAIKIEYEDIHISINEMSTFYWLRVEMVSPRYWCNDRTSKLLVWQVSTFLGETIITFEIEYDKSEFEKRSARR